jgi:hypothetical protein
MDEHRGIEIAIREYLSDVSEVVADLIAAKRVLYIVHSDIDNPAIVRKLEVVRRAVSRKNHHVLSTTIYGSMMVLCYSA